MNTRDRLFTPRGFLISGGVFLTLLGVLGLVVLNNPRLSLFWLDNGQNIAHLVVGLVALAAVFVPRLNDALRPYYRWIVVLVGLIALFFGVYGFVVPAGSLTSLNTFGVANLEVGDSLLYLLLAIWAFAAGYWPVREEMAARG